MNRIKNLCGFLVFIMGTSIALYSGWGDFESLLLGFLSGLFTLAMDWD